MLKGIKIKRENMKYLIVLLIIGNVIQADSLQNFYIKQANCKSLLSSVQYRLTSQGLNPPSRDYIYQVCMQKTSSTYPSVSDVAKGL